MFGISVIACASCRSGRYIYRNALRHGMIHVSKVEKQMDQVFHYVTNWKEGKVNQMFIQQITPEWQECGHQYVAVALNPETSTSMVMSKPRSHYDTLQWVKKFCGSFSLLY